LRVGIKEGRRLLLLSDLLMAVAWCSAVATASFDIVFYQKKALDPTINYTLTNFDASLEDFKYVLRV
jgi:hypothetical protein